jgi:ribonuclease J
MRKEQLPFTMESDAVYFIPLGGCGMFGANMSLYGYKGQWIMVDCGMGFADDTMPGVDILLPDPTFAVSLGESLLGIVLTHGHEDHIGAISSFWPRLKAPLYATHFTAARIRQSVGEQSWGAQAKIHSLPLETRLELGPFSIQYVSMAHSIPEANSLAISVEGVGTILHTGDWKIDKDPIVGELTDEVTLRELGDAGVLAVVGDSTNAMVPGHSGSEGTVRKNLAEMFGEFDHKIVISCFSTNVARLHSIYEAAKKNGRHVCLVGRSLWNVDNAARETGYLKDVPPFLDMDGADHLTANKLVFVCTGSQGEPRAALSRIANGEHPDISLGEGDVVIFSSRAIPGNDRAIDRIKNRLYFAGVNIVTDRDAPIHVSGHPYRDELKQLYSWLRPKICIPVHGEQMQMEKHALLAKECGISETLIPANGEIIEISKDGGRVVGTVHSGILAIEGKRIVAVDHEAILTRRRMMQNGSAIVTIVVGEQGSLLADPKITALGLLDENSDIDASVLREAELAVKEKIKNMPKDVRASEADLSEAVRLTVRRFFNDRFDRKPQTRVHLVKI